MKTRPPLTFSVHFQELDLGLGLRAFLNLSPDALQHVSRAPNRHQSLLNLGLSGLSRPKSLVESSGGGLHDARRRGCIGPSSIRLQRLEDGGAAADREALQYHGHDPK